MRVHSRDVLASLVPADPHPCSIGPHVTTRQITRDEFSKPNEIFVIILIGCIHVEITLCLS